VCSQIKETVDLIRTQLGRQLGPCLGDLSRQKKLLGLILGSGLGAFADSFQNRIVIPFSDLPHFPSPTVLGHSGNLVAGYAEGVPVVAVQGRVHLYEGYSIEEVAIPARVLGYLGIRRLVVTNAAGGINPVFHPGDLMLITDHINMMGTNPLIGPNMDEVGPRFPDMSEAYDAGMRDIALEAAKREKITLRQGVYLGLPGPSYETPAEIRMCRILGADAVGMSTIPEVIIANHMGMPVLGLSCITNMAAGMLPRQLTHKEVMDTADRTSGKFQSLLRTILSILADTP
jgi:purine-nucleoside phosphorylase